MRLRQKNKFTIENSSALSDMAFLLIIYFMVIAGFTINRGFLMDLPQKDSVKMVLRDELLRFSMDGGGDLHFQGRVMNQVQAESEISSAVRAKPNLAVILTVSPNAPWQRVVSFVELAQRLAVENFSFTMEKTVSVHEANSEGPQ
jgi:biopolymer transport protein ExbD